MARILAVCACTVSAAVHAALVREHLDQLAVGLSFAFAAILLVVAAIALSRKAGERESIATGVLLGALLVAYPVVHAISPEPVDAVGLATKAIEAGGLLCVLLIPRDGEERPLPLTFVALLGATAFLFALSLTQGHGH